MTFHCDFSVCHSVKTHRVTMFRFLYTVLVCVVVAGLMLPWGDGYSPVMSHISTRQQVSVGGTGS